MENKKLQKPHNFGREVTIKGLIIIGMIILLLVPILILQDKISEREGRKDEAVSAISNKWSREQTLDGPVLAIPYTYAATDKKGNVEQIGKTLYITPEKLDVKVSLVPEERKYGMFKAILYKSVVDISGEFSPIDLEKATSGTPDLSKAWIGMWLSDLRGLSEEVALTVDGVQYRTDNSAGHGSGIAFRPVFGDFDRTHTFNCRMELKGSEGINFIPVGRTTSVEVAGAWPDPSFVGNFTPDYTLADGGFTARWNILNFNRSIPDMWTDEDSDSYSQYDTTFGVTLATGADEYQQNERAVKYALLFVVLTFVVFFFVEVLTFKRIHPIQYLLVAAALMIFYTLLLSISEIVGFGWAYLISAVATVGLVTLYTSSIFKDRKETMLLSGILAGLYAYLYFILQLENYTLLVGSVGLFVILGVIMYVSRKVSWYREPEVKEE